MKLEIGLLVKQMQNIANTEINQKILQQNGKPK